MTRVLVFTLDWSSTSIPDNSCHYHESFMIALGLGHLVIAKVFQMFSFQ